jgi:hypothetical protein
MNREQDFTSTEALEFGLIDEIVTDKEWNQFNREIEVKFQPIKAKKAEN